MKTLGIVMTVLMVFGIFASAGIALAQDEGGQQGGEDGQNTVTIQISPTGIRPVAISAESGVVSPAEAIQAIGEDGSVLDANTFNSVIEEVDNSIGENGRKIGFLKGTYGKGYFTDSSNDHLGFIQFLLIDTQVTESNNAVDVVDRAAGKLSIDGKVYRVTSYQIEDDSINLDLAAVDGTDKGKLNLELTSSYDDNTRKVWTGKIELSETEGVVDLVTATRAVRKAPVAENPGDVQGYGGDGSILPYPSEDQTGPGNTNSGTTTGSSNRGLFQRIVDYFTAERVA